MPAKPTVQPSSPIGASSRSAYGTETTPSNRSSNVAPKPASAARQVSNGSRVTLIPGANPPPTDQKIQQVRIVSAAPTLAQATGRTMNGSSPSEVTAGEADSRSFSLQAALYGSLRSNPDLVTLRQGALPNTPSAEAVEVARRFPTTLNPTLWIDYRPVTLIPPETFVKGSTGPKPPSFYHNGSGYLYLSYRQPLELGHQTTHRYNIAKAAYQSQRWTVVQAEMLALVQTYRFFQTAAYRREKMKAAIELADSTTVSWRPSSGGWTRTRCCPPT